MANNKDAQTRAIMAKMGKSVDKNAPEHRLEHLRKQIKKEKISYGEIAELQGLKKHIKPHDTELREWAGIPEGR
jgi:hypothetical protein